MKVIRGFMWSEKRFRNFNYVKGVEALMCEGD
jgi:hypothetical protein